MKHLKKPILAVVAPYWMHHMQKYQTHQNIEDIIDRTHVNVCRGWSHAVINKDLPIRFWLNLLRENGH